MQTIKSHSGSMVLAGLIQGCRWKFSSMIVRNGEESPEHGCQDSAGIDEECSIEVKEFN